VELDLDAAVAKALKAKRGQMPHREFAQIIGLSDSMAYRYERRLLDVKLKHVSQIAHRLNCSVETILGLPSAKSTYPHCGDQPL